MQEAALSDSAKDNLQTLSLHSPGQGPAADAAVGGPAINVVGEAAVVAPQSPSTGEESDFTSSYNNDKQASIYVVREGDTLGEVADMFRVSVDTIVWANDIQDGSISPQDVLVILPTSGVRHEAEEDDTLESIASRYDSSVEEIRDYNQLDADDELAAGAIIDVPGGKMPQQASPSDSSQSNVHVAGSGAVTPTDTADVSSSYYAHPVPGSVVTQIGRAHV